MRKPLKKSVASVMMDDRLGEDRAQRRHALPQPSRNTAAVER